MNLEAKVYDVDGNEVKVPEGHLAVIGNNQMIFIKNEEASYDFVYRPPDENDPRYQKAKKILDE
jgi:hypothetical protein